MSENPYQPSSQLNENEFAPPSAERPTSVKVFGILNIVFAVMGICGLAFSIVAFYFSQNVQIPNPAIDMMNESVGYRIFMAISMTLGFIFSVVLLIGGVGLLQGRKYGRSASIAYGWYAIIAAVGGAVANYFFLFAPMMEQIQQGPQEPAAMGGLIGGVVGGIFGALFGMLYPTILLIFMYRRKVADSLS